MPTSIFLARLLAPVFLPVGIGALLNREGYRKLADEFLRSDALIYLSGLLIMTAGMAVILTHNVWAADWRVLITLLGWLTVIGGALRIVMPQRVETIGRWFIEHPSSLTIAAAIWLAVGVILAFFGYFH